MTQDEEIKRLEHEKAFLLAMLRDIEDMADRGELDSQQVSVAIRQVRGQLESGEVLRKNLKPGLKRSGL
jgi:hypothetical protein